MFDMCEHCILPHGHGTMICVLLLDEEPNLGVHETYLSIVCIRWKNLYQTHEMRFEGLHDCVDRLHLHTQNKTTSDVKYCSTSEYFNNIIKLLELLCQ